MTTNTLRDSICVRVPRSRRKLEAFERLLDRKPQYLFSFHFEGNFVNVDTKEFKRVKPYVTKARVDFTKLLQCWS